ncbi:MAG TPA: phenylalanine--tRNA ligase subunit alpha [Clostridiales bacterium]|nr:MAG: phenylalanine--tRNA ligase subunit alpha [Clostridiales bacterium GWD2_32_59]HAN09879.1 phenylalanine--tRNA ligase subunit alpha [Clostridiales bacterium]
MKVLLESIKLKTLEELQNVTDLKTLEEIKVGVLGKKGELTEILRGMKDLSTEERPIVGQIANEVREVLEQKMNDIKNELETNELNKALQNEKIDVTVPGKKHLLGTAHPLSIVTDEISKIFMGMGYKVAEGPDIELDYYNFEALNIPENHPAKDEQDTFYITKNIVLRTQTSPVQIRSMEVDKPPIKMIAPGRVFRSDQVDATHSPVFHQIEGLVVDKGITMGDLKGVLNTFVKELFGEDTITKFRPHHFQFTEPSAEVDVSCFKCKGEDSSCKVCKGEGWIEILGCGMVHPQVLKNCGIDPEVYSGFAFGMGVERVAMLKYGIEDLRLFYENDVRFLRQF